MALIDRFDQDATANGFTPLPVHEFSKSLTLLAAPAPVTVNKALIISNPLWTLTENPAPDADELQLDQMIFNYGALATLEEKNQYVMVIEATLIFYQTSTINQNTAKTWIGLI